MNVLVACEYSARVRDAFRARGHDAWSCDLLPSEGSWRWHIKGNVLPLLEMYDEPWDLLIAFPPCTDLSKAGARWWPEKIADGRQQRAIDFVDTLWKAPIEKVCIENPVGALSTKWRKPTQYVEPWQFGDPYQKKTCLWLRGLPPLKATHSTPSYESWVGGDAVKSGKHRDPHKRSLTFQGIANAMAEQWG